MQIDTAQVRALANDLEDSLSEVSVEARDAVKDSVDDGRALLVARSADLRDVLGERAGVWGGRARDRAGDLATEVGGELEQRAEVLRDAVRSRAREIEQDLPVDADDAWAYAQMGGWQVVRGVIAVVAFVPRLLVRLLGGLSRLVDRLAGVDVPARGRELVAAVPLASARRPVSRRRTVLLLVIGGVVGFAGGVAASRRRAPIVTYDVPPPRPAVDPVAVGGDGSDAATADHGTADDGTATDGDADGA